MGYLARRIGFYLVTAWAAITMNFFVPRLLPGNPAQIIEAKLQGNGAILTPGMIAEIQNEFGGTHGSLISQYLQYLDQLAHLNFGLSVAEYPSTVVSVIMTGLPWTLGLIGMATIISFVVGTVIGTFAAWRRGSWLDALLPATYFMQALPYFFVGLVAIEIFGVTLHWFPDSGGFATTLATGWNWTFISSVLYHAFLPALTIVLTSISGWMVGQRNMMTTTLDQDYIMVAQAKGISQRRVMWMYAARNAVLPNFASFSVALGLVVGGSIIVEIVFSYPGIGYWLLQAVGGDDYSLMQGIFLIITLSVLGANFIADLVYVLVDPRARQEL
jgi:peptide/nickel transport system permease protein